jgi:hypothetical protein
MMRVMTHARHSVVLAIAALLTLPGPALGGPPNRAGDPVPPGSIESLVRPQTGQTIEPGPGAVPFRTRNPEKLRRAKNRAATGRGTGPGPSPKSSAINPANQPGLSAAGSTPPDATGAIGTSHYIEMVNSQIAVYSRATLGLVSQIDLDNFVGRPTNFHCDPQVLWDQQASRWFYAALDCDGGSQNFLVFGWSKTASPTPLPSSTDAGNWCRFAQSTGSVIDDYPKLATNDGHVLIGTDVFQGNSYLTARIWAYEKPSAGDQSCAIPPGFSFGSALNPLLSADGDIVFTPVPAQGADGGANGYVTAADFPEFGPASQLMVWHVTGGGGGGSPSLVSDGNVNVASYDFPLNVPQPSSSRVLDSLDTRLTQSVAMSDPDVSGAKGVWTQHTVDGPGAPSVVRWYELVPSFCNGTTCPAAALKQAGTVSHATHFVFNGAISPTGNGQDAVIHYNLGSGSLLAQIHARWHDAGMAAGATAGDILIGSSVAAAQDFSCNPGPCRWGDYAGATPDPTRDDTVWGSNQLLGSPSGNNPKWTTRNFAIQVLSGYVRPAGATPLRASLVPAYAACSASNRTHGPPLAFGSCAPPQQTSTQLTIGTPDANGQAAVSLGAVRLAVVPGDPVSPPDEADVNAQLSLTDVRRQGTLADYAGELQGALAVRLTDGANGASQSEAATVSDLSFPITVPCVPTGGAAGSNCSVATSFDAIVPGSVQEGKRSIWALDRVEVFDGGADGLASTTPNTLFAVQGVFVP